MVFAHGFTQTGRSWKPIAEYFAAHGYEAVVVDLPGHGGSVQVRADLRRGADLLASTCSQAVYVGYSMGGRHCLHLALMYPHLVPALAILGADPGIDDDEARAARRGSDERLAAEVIDEGVPEFLRRWTAQPLFGGYVADPAELADRQRNTADGLASSLRLAGTGAQGSLWPRLWEISAEMLVMAGALDAKFVAIGEQVAEVVDNARLVLIPDAAHAAHLQQPALMAAALAEWLGRLPADALSR
jgi:2-succinyl-6-hydroxy-2,4-cyclohexadiene-1-carboxylate synthase